MAHRHEAYVSRAPAGLWESLGTDADWRHKAECGSGRHDRDLWLASTQNTRAVAAHICIKHCPVIADCDAWARDQHPDYRQVQVIGGVRYDKAGLPAHRQPVADHCSECRPMFIAPLPDGVDDMNEDRTTVTEYVTEEQYIIMLSTKNNLQTT